MILRFVGLKYQHFHVVSLRQSSFNWCAMAGQARVFGSKCNVQQAGRACAEQQSASQFRNARCIKQAAIHGATVSKLRVSARSLFIYCLLCCLQLRTSPHRKYQSCIFSSFIAFSIIFLTQHY